MQQPDHNDALVVQQRLRDTANALHDQVGQVALARQVKEFSSDRRKALLARYMRTHLDEGKSSAAAETIARSGEAYQAELKLLEDHYRQSEEAIAKWTATQATFDAARSLMSMSKEAMKLL